MEKGLEFLQKKLKMHEPRVTLRYKQYDMKYKDRDMGITIPPKLRMQYQSTLGWCSKAVDSLADRLIFKEFGNDLFYFNEIFAMNNPDTFFDSAILSALISSCCFVYISSGDEPIPRLQIIEGSNATGIIDPITGLLHEGYAVFERDDQGDPIVEAHFLKGRTDFYTNGKFDYSISNTAPFPLLVPIVHRPDAVWPFGRSRISRAAMEHQAYAKRTLERSDVTAEFYSFPQKYVLGTSQDAEQMDKWRATVTSLLEITKDDDGDSPSVGQFSTASMTPFIEQLRMAASLFAGETGLTLDDLGFVSDNPSSSEAIKAAHENLRLAARKAQRNFGSGFLNVGYLAACVRDGIPYKRSQFYQVQPKWKPVFEPDAATLSLIGDGAIKLNQAIPGYFDMDSMSELTGIEGAD